MNFEKIKYFSILCNMTFAKIVFSWNSSKLMKHFLDVCVWIIFSGIFIVRMWVNFSLENVLGKWLVRLTESVWGNYKVQTIAKRSRLLSLFWRFFLWDKDSRISLWRLFFFTNTRKYKCSRQRNFNHLLSRNNFFLRSKRLYYIQSYFFAIF